MNFTWDEFKRQSNLQKNGLDFANTKKVFNSPLVLLEDKRENDGEQRMIAIGLHALCWIHAERLIHKLIPINDAQRQAIAVVRGQVWDFYADLTACLGSKCRFAGGFSASHA